MNDSQKCNAVSRAMQGVAKRLDKDIKAVTGHRFGFMLVIFTPVRASWINTIDRKDAIEQLEEILRLWKEGMPDVPAHEVTQ